MPTKPKRVWVGNTPVTPITPKERRKLHKLMKKRLDMRRRRYFEVRGKVVDYIRYSIDDGVLCMNACFRDKTPLFRQFPSHSKSSSSYLKRRDPTEPEVPGDPIGLGDCCAVAGCSLILYQKKHGPAQESSGPCRCRAGVFS